MKTLLSASIFVLGYSLAHGDYTGTVTQERRFKGGAEAVDLDGIYPHQKMILYVPVTATADVGPLPPIGVKITVAGPVIQYRGQPEIKVLSPGQWTW